MSRGASIFRHAFYSIVSFFCINMSVKYRLLTNFPDISSMAPRRPQTQTSPAAQAVPPANNQPSEVPRIQRSRTRVQASEHDEDFNLDVSDGEGSSDQGGNIPPARHVRSRGIPSMPEVATQINDPGVRARKNEPKTADIRHFFERDETLGKNVCRVCR